jgi:alkylhydroperoxidase family enzyme
MYAFSATLAVGHCKTARANMRFAAQLMGDTELRVRSSALCQVRVARILKAARGHHRGAR